MIRTAALRRVYRTETVETTALAGLDLEIARGELVAVMGPSGAGKSTLLNLLGLLENPTDGQYFLLGDEVARYSERRRTRLRKSHVGFVFQNFNLLDDLTVLQNVELPLAYRRVPAAERRRRAGEILERLGIAERKDYLPHQLSGGQQQRVAIARAVIVEPELILADEPTGNLDSARGNEVMELLREINGTGTTIVVATHSPADAGRCHRIVHLFDGHLMSDPHKSSQPPKE